MNDNDRKDVYRIEHFLAGLFLCFFLALLLFMIIVPDFHSKAALWKARIHGKNEWPITSKISDDVKEDGFIFELPEDIGIDNIKVSTSLRAGESVLKVDGIDAAYPEDYKLKGKSKVVRDVYFSYEQEQARIKFKLNSMFEPIVKVSNDKLYINFKNANEVYRKIILIDASLGGDQKGVEFNGSCEKDINLAVVKKAKKIIDKEKPADTKVYYTRLKDETISEEKRITMLNESMADYFVSVGLNSTSSGRISDMKGISTYYMSTNPKSKSLAVSYLDSLVTETSGANRGIIPGDNNRILEATNKVSILVKLGFATNGEERELLTQKDYQDKLARGLANAVLNSIKGE